MSSGATNPGTPSYASSQFPSDAADRYLREQHGNFNMLRGSPAEDEYTGNHTGSGMSVPNHSNGGGISSGSSNMGNNGMNNISTNNSHSNSNNNSNSNSNNSNNTNTNNSNNKPGQDPASRLRQTFNTRSASPLSRPPLFSPNLMHEAEKAFSQTGMPSMPNAVSPPPRNYITSPRYFADANRQPHQQQSQQAQYSHSQQQQHQHQHPNNWVPRSAGMGPLDFHPSISPVSFNSADRPHSSMSEGTFPHHDGAPRSAMGGHPTGSGSNKEPEFSIFVGDLSPDLREEDLVTQFLQPPAWPPNHPFAAALIHAQQAQGIYQPGNRVGPAPFLSTKSAKIMTDPVTGASKGYGFVRFTLETDCNRALVEMQGVVVTPANGLSPGRPLRVSTATPKNRSMPPPPAPMAPGSSGDHPNHLQMPRPHNPAQDAAFLYAGPNGPNGPSGPNQLGNRPNVVSPQPHAQRQPSPSHHFMSPTSPTSPFDGPGGIPGQPSFGALHGGFPGPAGSDPSRAISPGAIRSQTPSSMPGGSSMQQSGSQGDSATDPNNTTVFVGGLSSLISEATLRRYFEHFGEITYVKIPPGKGCGFVQYVRKQDAEHAIQRMNGFPILNSKIRLSWGRSQGDKAAAAAAQTMAQYAQLGQLAGLAGLSTLSPSQLAQLAGLGSALSAAQAQAQRSGNGFGPAGANLANDPLSTLARQLAAANTSSIGGIGGGSVGGSSVHNAGSMGGPGNLPAFLQQQASHGGPNGLPSGSGFPQHGHGAQQSGFDYEGRGGGPLHPHHAGFPHALSPNQLQDLGLRSRSQFQHGGTPPLSESELADAFANLDFDESTRMALAQRLQAQHGGNGAPGPQPSGRADPFGRSGYNRDPNAFMFSPFSPSDSPVVGGKADLPGSSNLRHDDNDSGLKKGLSSPDR